MSLQENTKYFSEVWCRAFILVFETVIYKRKLLSFIFLKSFRRIGTDIIFGTIIPTCWLAAKDIKTGSFITGTI